jgi:hypothetical protein
MGNDREAVSSAQEIWDLRQPASNPSPHVINDGPQGPDRFQLIDLFSHRDRDREVAYAMDEDPNVVANQQELGRRLYLRYVWEMSLGNLPHEDSDPIDFVHWLFSLKRLVTESAWRSYRNAVRALVSPHPHENRDLAIAILQNDVNRRLPRATQSVQIAKADFDRLHEAFANLRRLHSEVENLAITLVATGLQPDELATTLVETRGMRTWLHVGMEVVGRDVYFRTLDVSDLRDSTLNAARSTIEECQLWARENRFGDRIAACDRAFANVGKSVLAHARLNVSFSTLQHQFVANAATRYTAPELAALVGFDPGGILQRQRTSKRPLAWRPDEIPGCPVPNAQFARCFEKTFKLADDKQTVKKGDASSKPRKAGDASSKPRHAAE